MEISEKILISKELQSYDYIFRAFWELGNIKYSDEIETAAIKFDKEGQAVDFIINKNFWNSLNQKSKIFIICHECLHFIFKHGIRFKEHINTNFFKCVNIASDVVINEFLINSLDFNREELDEKISKNGCWHDTVFKEDKDVKKNKNTDYYFNILKKKDVLPEVFRFDEHVFLTEKDIESSQKYIENNIDIDSFMEEFSENSLEINSLTAGSEGGKKRKIEVEKKIKKKWESVIKDWAIKKISHTIDYSERWDRTSLRYSNLTNNIKLPSYHWIFDEFYKNDMIEVFFFMDNSGSCYHLANRFFSAAKSLDPKKFKIRLFSFDAYVQELNINKSTIYGGGGTRFDIIENKIQNIIIKEKIKYPDAVFIITDGYGNNVYPEFPKKWHWFLTTHNSTYCIPSESLIYNLEDFE